MVLVHGLILNIDSEAFCYVLEHPTYVCVIWAILGQSRPLPFLHLSSRAEHSLIERCWRLLRCWKPPGSNSMLWQSDITKDRRWTRLWIHFGKLFKPGQLWISRVCNEVTCCRLSERCASFGQLRMYKLLSLERLARSSGKEAKFGQNVIARCSRADKYCSVVGKEIMQLQFSIDKEISAPRFFIFSGKAQRLRHSLISKNSKDERFSKSSGRERSSGHQRIINVFKYARLPIYSEVEQSFGQELIFRYSRRGLLSSKFPRRCRRSLKSSITRKEREDTWAAEWRIISLQFCNSRCWRLGIHGMFFSMGHLLIVNLRRRGNSSPAFELHQYSKLGKSMMVSSCKDLKELMEHELYRVVWKSLELNSIPWFASN